VERPQIIIYESSSRGGCYDYALQLAAEFHKALNDTTVNLILPGSELIKKNSHAVSVRLILLPDSILKNPFIARFYFLFRSVINPLILYLFLLFKVKARSIVIFNDYDQISAWLWVPLFTLIKGRFRFIVMLHDPDRDSYPPGRWFSVWTMRKIMSLVHVAAYHEVLPDKKYYKNTSATYLCLRHGIYPPGDHDETLYREIKKRAFGRVVLSVPGHLRDEKNYRKAIEMVGTRSEYFLVIAGSASNSSFDTAFLMKELDEKLGSNKYLFINRYLDALEFSSVLAASDWIWLYYLPSFASQSGVLSRVANYHKPVIVSRLPNGLTRVVEEFNLGICLDPEDETGLIEAFNQMATMNLKDYVEGWKKYRNEANWEKQVLKIVDAVE
jgi:hypothetical protein